MATYYFLVDMYVNGNLILAGTTASTSDVGGVLPQTWLPPAEVDPMDTPAIAAYLAMGPRNRAFFREQWTQFPVALPSHNWSFINGRWVLSNSAGIAPAAPLPLVSEQNNPLTSEDGKVLVVG